MLTQKKYGEKFFHSELKGQYKYLDRIKKESDKGKDPNGNDIPPIANVAQLDKLIELYDSLSSEKFRKLLVGLREDVVPYQK